VAKFEYLLLFIFRVYMHNVIAPCLPLFSYFPVIYDFTMLALTF